MLNEIIHIVMDEKFIDDVIVDCEAVAPGIHSFIVIQQVSQPLKHIKNTSFVTSMSLIEIETLLRNGKGIRLAIFHSLFSIHPYLVRIAHPNLKIMCTLWGGEFYLAAMGSKLFAPMTIDALSLIPEFQAWHNIDNRLISEPQKVYEQFCPHVKEALIRANFIATILPTEIDLLSKWLGIDVSQKFVRISYGGVEAMVGNDLFNQEINTQQKKSDILIGNSNAVTNNHIDVIAQLSTIKQNKSRWIVPLSYVDPPSYQSLIIQVGLKFGKNKFFPLLNFMDRNRYNQILSTCSCAIFRHHRQQAVGNVLTTMWIGAKIYVSEYSPITPFLSSIGCHFSSIEAEKDPQGFVTPLTYAQIDQNRQAIMNEYSVAKVRERFRILPDL